MIMIIIMLMTILMIMITIDKIRVPKRPYNVLFILWILMKFLHKTQLEAHLRRRECQHEKLSGV